MAAGNASRSSRQGNSGAGFFCICPHGELYSVSASPDIAADGSPRGWDNYQIFRTGRIRSFPQLEVGLTPRYAGRRTHQRSVVDAASAAATLETDRALALLVMPPMEGFGPHRPSMPG